MMISFAAGGGVMDNVVSKLIESIKRAYAKLAENGYDTGKEMITLSHDSIFALVNAIEEMEKQLEESQKSYESACDVAGDYYHEIRELESAAPKWISVEERLPEDDDVFVLCAVKDGRETIVTEGWYLKRNGEISPLDEDYALCDVTHWMPMPEPPEVE